MAVDALSICDFSQCDVVFMENKHPPKSMGLSLGFYGKNLKGPTVYSDE